jgi:GntR family transcriptional regulator, transcriptional repressor for pyruvate dehydrogenase complex
MTVRKTVTSKVINHILRLIKSEQVKPGERLPTEKELTVQLGVSRTCVREAVKSLESLGMLRVRARIGAVLLEPTSASILNAVHYSRMVRSQPTDVVVEFRKLIEGGLAGLAAEKATREDLRALEDATIEHRRCIEAGAPAFKADVLFHSALAKAAKNAIAIVTLESVSSILLEQRRQTNRVPGAAEAGLRDHLRILRAIKEKNPEKARAAMHAHMTTADHYLRLFKAATPSTKEVSGKRSQVRSPNTR